MLTPEYSAIVVVGGTGQSKTFKALPDQLITRQSGDITLIHKDAAGLPFDISSLTGSDFQTVPFESGELPTTLATGVVGFTREIFTLTSNAVPPTGGTFVLRVAGENTAAIAYNATAAIVQTALEALTSRSPGDFVVTIEAKENLSKASAKILIETSGGFAISFDSTIDDALLTAPIESIKLAVTQAGSDIQNEYNASWDKDTIPDTFSQFDFDASGAISFFIALEDGDDFIQSYQRINCVDGDFIGSGGNIPSNAVYVYSPADSNRWLRISTSSPSTMNDGLDKIVNKNFRDFGTVISKIAIPPGSPSDGDAYIVIPPAAGAFAGLEQQIATFSSTLAAWSPSNVHKDWDEVRNEADGALYRYNSTGPTWDVVVVTGVVASAVTNTPAGNIAATDVQAAINELDANDDTQDTAIALNTSHRANMSDPHDVTATQVGNTVAQWNADQFLGKTIAASASTPSNEDVLSFNTSTQEWEPGTVPGGGGGGRPAFEQNFDTDTSGTEPASGAVKFDNGTPGSVTTIRASTTDINGINITNQLSSVGSGDAFIVYQIDDTARFLYFSVTSSTLATTSYNIVGTSISGGVIIESGKACGIAAYVLTVGGASGVASFNGRTAGVIPALGDYPSNIIGDSSLFGGPTVEDSFNAVFNTLSPEAVAAGVDNIQAGVAYPLVLTDKDNTNIVMTSALSNAVTIPLNATVALPLATKIPVLQRGVGITTINGETGVTINGVLNGSVVVNNQHQGALLWQVAANDWEIPGDVT
jgi:hypothetical protein